MKKILFLFLLAAGASAQTTTFSATITDSDSQTWNNGTWQASLYSPNGPPFSGGSPVTPTVYSGSLNSSGAFSQVLPSNDKIFPSGSQWNFTLCPNASFSCSSVMVTVTGTTQNGSTVLSAGVKVPRFPAGPYSYGYLDAEIVTVPLPGGVYYNVTSQTQRVWNGSAWVNGASGGGVTSINSTAGAFTFTGSGVSCTTTTCTFSGGGGLSSFTVGNLSPLFTASLGANPTTAPALVFTASTAAQNSFLAGPSTGGTGAYSFRAIVAADVPTLNQSTTGNAATATALASTPTLCSTGNAPTGILANGNATGCASITGGSGNTTSTSLTTNTIPVANGPNSIINSLLTDNGTTATYSGTGGISAALLSSTGGCPGSTGGGCDQIVYGTDPTGLAGSGSLWYDSSGNPHSKPGTGTSIQLMGTTTSVTSSQLPSQYKILTCQPGLDGPSSSTAIGAGTYTQVSCYNATGVTWTLTSIKCYTDNNGTSALSVTNGAGTALLTGAVTCTNSFASGTQSATTTIASGDYVKFSFVADASTKNASFVITGTY
jgi:hypothetical protein